MEHGIKARLVRQKQDVQHWFLLTINGASMSEDLKKTIIDYIRKEYFEEDSSQELNENTRLISSGIVDSFSMISLKIFLERRFQIKIPDDSATTDAFDSVENILNLVKQYTKA